MTPDNGLGVRVHVEILLQLGPREWVQLLDTGDGDILDILVGTVLVQGGIDLTGAENDTINLIWLVDGLAVFRVWNDPLELGITCELFNRRSCERMTEKGLGEEDDKSCRIISRLD